MKVLGERYRNAVAVVGAVLALSAQGCGGSRVTSASGMKATGNRTGYLRGFRAIDQVVKARLIDLDPSGFLDIGSLLEGGTVSSDLTGFRLLLGGFGPASAHAEFQNGAPNAVNMLLWQMILGRLADGLASGACDGSGRFPMGFGPVAIRDPALEVLRPLCSGAHAPGALQRLWLLVMGFEAPPEERDAWLTFAGGPVPLADLLRSLFLDPYFLLEY